MLTANSQLNIKTQLYNIGCDDYLSKPFEPIELILRIKKLLNPRINNIRVDKNIILWTLFTSQIQKS